METPPFDSAAYGSALELNRQNRNNNITIDKCRKIK